ncbi:MAG TPA: signal recognition particle-docking protein FtsY [Thermotogota bacterium]|nr:signal recognition particle-docking protein FtsY [Thermotogota bacterium]HPJ88420.1 signal recognition particle-docking protein FtsY [Thermotogota bacterium]HPR95413.1 signal recognition particle-docking protein FtsY [Thermotogota bacterium]
MGFFDKLKSGLKKTNEAIFGKITRILKYKKLDEDTLEEIEELLIMGDVGVDCANKIIDELQARQRDFETLDDALREIMIEMLEGDNSLKYPDEGPLVISVVGVNGAGKTTTIGKMAKSLKEEGKDVVLAAADTFRAAAIDQLRVWAEDRADVTLISHQHGADAGAVAFDAVQHGYAKGKDVVIIDTAGRLHNKVNLMNELTKVHKVVKKVIPEAPHEILLVIDATTGQNGLIQAEKFAEAVGVTGIVITKLDGTAKGGIALSIKETFGIPIKFIGVGEGVDDLKPFVARDFVKALIDETDE